MALYQDMNVYRKIIFKIKNFRITIIKIKLYSDDTAINMHSDYILQYCTVGRK